MRRPPYLPFLSGAPDFAVGLKPIAPASWLLPDVENSVLVDKRALLTMRREEVYQASESVAPVQKLVEEMVRAELAAGDKLPDPSPLVRAAALVSDDLVVLTRDAEVWRTQALVLCAPTFFSAAHALGKTLDALHEPVPDKLGPSGTQALGARISRVFDGLRDDIVLERFNWTVQAGPDRFTPDGAPLRARAASAAEADALDMLHLRVERQTIRKLPGADAILFMIRVAIDPLRPVLENPTLRDAFAHAWGHAPAHVRAYKKWDVYERLVRAALACAA